MKYSIYKYGNDTIYVIRILDFLFVIIRSIRARDILSLPFIRRKRGCCDNECDP